MPPVVLFPLFDHDAIEERYASWQAQMLHKRGGGELVIYSEEDTARHAVADVQSKIVLVVTDPLLLPPPGLSESLERVLAASGAFAAVPVSNEGANQQQRIVMKPYLTLREFEIEAAAIRNSGKPATRVVWDHSDPGLFLCATESLAQLKVPLRTALDGQDVAISHSDFVHRWASLRGQTRLDLLSRISTDAKSVLEFGCGEATLGQALKQRQKCRVVGVELDQKAAAIARKRIDDVYCADVRELVTLLGETFDWIVGGDIVEHLDEPWSFLAELRRLSNPGGRLLLSLPNIANASVIGDLMRGRFDYVYMGLTCVGHLRFFTRRSIEEMLAISGWLPETIEPQPVASTPEQEKLLAAITAAGIDFSRDDVLAPGYYVTARNRA